MKREKIMCAAAAVLSAALAACSAGDFAEVAEDTASVTKAEATSAEITSAVTTAESATKTTAEDTSETEEEIPQVAEETEGYVQVSPNNEFIDFEFIEDYQGTTDIGELADKAVEFLKTTDEYAESMKNIAEFSDGEFSDYIADGVIVPKFRIAYPNDYDGDGRIETFIAVDMPVRYYYDNILTSFYIYADCGEKMTLLNVSGKTNENAVFLNYGRDKQIAFGGGLSPYGSVSYLYGVKEGDPVLLYSEQAGLEKRACFLRSHGFQAIEKFMYFDTAAREYRQIASVQIPLEKLKDLDASGSLNSVFEEHGDNFSAWVVGGKYYCIKVMFEFADVYTYDNGTFTLMSDPPVGLNLPKSVMSVMPCVKDIDIDEAIAEMKPPVEPFVKVSTNNEFIDYEFIEDYQGTTDIGDLADKAIEFMKESKQYKESMENIEGFTVEGMLKVPDTLYSLEGAKNDAAKFAEYISDGVIEPVITAAYPNDYDGDGNTETFIIIEMPSLPAGYVYGFVRDFVVFSDKDGNMEIVDENSNMSPAVLLNYGDFRHIAIGGAGRSGAEDHTYLYGVSDGKAVRHYGDRCGFAKEDCFLSVFGWQGRGDFMYFDTAAQEYRVIDGVDIDVEDVKAMDTSNSLADVWADSSEKFLHIELIGGKYYCIIRGAMDWGTIYTYDNGIFTLVEDSNVRISMNLCELKEVVDIDIERAIAEMKPVEN